MKEEEKAFIEKIEDPKLRAVTKNLMKLSDHIIGEVGKLADDLEKNVGDEKR